MNRAIKAGVAAHHLSNLLLPHGCATTDGLHGLVVVAQPCCADFRPLVHRYRQTVGARAEGLETFKRGGVFLLTTTIKGNELRFATDEGVFSPQAVDTGTLAMLSQVEFSEGDRVLDLGCGYGVVGILAAKLIGPESVVMTDVSELAVELARRNAVLNGVGEVAIYHCDGFKNLTETDFTLILANPPYHTDFAVPKEFIEKGFNRLRLGGRMVMVTKRKDWYKNKLIAIFGGVKIAEINGYFVFTAEKRSMRYAR